jgi:hypothetical protein
MYELTEADGDLQIVTECWIEPQYGVVINSSPERQHWEGLTYKQIARAVSTHHHIMSAQYKIKAILSGKAELS